ncbi:MAG: 30S ribosomal protein S20 [Planctomycetes bacterium]|nr:30S ribosomal protein S20 [Planctomycetota bacterium]
MAHSLSAKKRARQNETDRATNRARKSQVKTQIKHLEVALEQGDAQAAAEQLRLVSIKLDKTAAKSTMHKKTASRKKSRLAKRVNALAAQSSS